MSIAFDAAANGTGAGGATSITWNHTCSGTNRYLVVAVYAAMNHADATVATYHGASMDRIAVYEDKATFGGGVRWWVYLFGLKNPDTGGAYAVVVSDSNSNATDWDGCSASYTGVDQTTPTGTQGSGNDNGTFDAPTNTASCTVASAVGELVVDATGGSDANDPYTATGTGQTKRAANTVWTIINLSDTPGAATTTVSYSIPSTGDSWVSVGVPLKPAPAFPSPSVNLIYRAKQSA